MLRRRTNSELVMVSLIPLEHVKAESCLLERAVRAIRGEEVVDVPVKRSCTAGKFWWQLVDSDIGAVCLRHEVAERLLLQLQRRHPLGGLGRNTR